MFIFFYHLLISLLITMINESINYFTHSIIFIIIIFFFPKSSSFHFAPLQMKYTSYRQNRHSKLALTNNKTSKNLLIIIFLIVEIKVHLCLHKINMLCLFYLLLILIMIFFCSMFNTVFYSLLFLLFLLLLLLILPPSPHPCTIVKPLRVTLIKPGKPFVSGQKAELECLSYGSKPTPQLKWFKANKEIINARETLSTDINFTRSHLTFLATTEDNGRYISCRSQNPNIPESSLEDGFNMIIYCK